MRKLLASAGMCTLLLFGPASIAAAAGSPRTLHEALETAGENDPVPIIVTLSDRLDVAAFRDSDKHARRMKIVEALKAKAGRTHGQVLALLRESGATGVKPLWVINGIAATTTRGVIRELSKLPGVASVVLDASIEAPTTTLAVASASEWNLAAIHAPALWSLGFVGAGAVVANMDTGVDVQHLDLGSRWRGGTDSWYDPYRNTTLPYDAIGHGTQTMGIMVGGDAGGTAIGVAPGAKWIAAKIYDDTGHTTLSVIHQAFQWLLAPSGVPGAPDAPDVVDASWGLSTVNGCDTTFQSDFEALRAAGIVVVFAAGNSGPNSLTSISPANNVDGYSVGAVDDTSSIAYFSSRGSSACTGFVYPDLVAPGVSIRTSDISLGGVPLYAYVSGTSFSAPHVAGTAALLAGAFPSAGVNDIEATLRSTALDLGATGADNDYGYGLVDAYAAYAAIGALLPPSIDTTSLPDAHLGVAYGQTLRVSNGVAPHAWAVTIGSLPAGLNLDPSTGSIAGVPTTPGASSFTVQLRDASGALAARPLSINVLGAPLRVTTFGMTAGRVGRPYSQTLQAAGGTAPYTWSLAAGALPPRLVLGAGSGTILGVPTTRGTYPFAVRVRDASGTVAARTFSITIQ